jgi:hypothetical protein
MHTAQAKPIAETLYFKFGLSYTITFKLGRDFGVSTAVYKRKALDFLFPHGCIAALGSIPTVSNACIRCSLKINERQMRENSATPRGR